MIEINDSAAILRVATGVRADAEGWRLVAEAALFTLVGTALLVGAGLPEAGLFAVVLATAALDGRMRRLLDAHREAVAARPRHALAAHRRTVFALAALFVGIGLAFVAVALCLGPGELPGRFGQALATEAHGGDILSRQFNVGVGALLRHNLATMTLFVVLGFFYRSAGALLALGWNAAVWAVVLTALIARGLDHTTLSAPVFILGSLAAVLPHLLVELLGYALATLATLCAAQAVVRARVEHAPLLPALRPVAGLLLAAVISLALAAVLEDRFAPFMFTHLR